MKRFTDAKPLNVVSSSSSMNDSIKHFVFESSELESGTSSSGKMPRTKAELDRFCDALISFREEIAEIEKGKTDITNNVLKVAPHPPSPAQGRCMTKPYSQDYAAFPDSWLRVSKFWPSTGRVDNAYVDDNLICTLQPASHVVEEQAAATA
ncbi:hypothetical protein RIF29_25052 [Crotalaria pallida]|uniref:Glycine dehydrogenase C-terminal domain-containing protein n=1 Tax=Crotalaria pallida TaxID=3830 RepID=A0AAN9EN32_CROPI